MSQKHYSWLRLSFDVWRASFEAQQVIALRLAMLAGGGIAATAEMNRMVSEKMAAATRGPASRRHGGADRQRRANSVADGGSLPSKDARQPQPPHRRKVDNRAPPSR